MWRRPPQQPSGPPAAVLPSLLPLHLHGCLSARSNRSPSTGLNNRFTQSFPGPMLQLQLVPSSRACGGALWHLAFCLDLAPVRPSRCMQRRLQQTEWLLGVSCLRRQG